MSYDIRIGVQIANTDIIYPIGEPNYASPTYNLGKMFRVCTGWDFNQGEWYRADRVIEKIEHGWHELIINREQYRVYEPENKWGTVEGAIKILDSFVRCIYEFAEDIPIDCLWVKW